MLHHPCTFSRRSASSCLPTSSNSACRIVLVVRIDVLLDRLTARVGGSWPLAIGRRGTDRWRRAVRLVVQQLWRCSPYRRRRMIRSHRRYSSGRHVSRRIDVGCSCSRNVVVVGHGTTGKGRHDPCVVPRAVPIVEAMAALVVADHLLRQRMVKL